MIWPEHARTRNWVEIQKAHSCCPCHKNCRPSPRHLRAELHWTARVSQKCGFLCFGLAALLGAAPSAANPLGICAVSKTGDVSPFQNWDSKQNCTKLMNMINTFTHNEQIHDIYIYIYLILWWCDIDKVMDVMGMTTKGMTWQSGIQRCSKMQITCGLEDLTSMLTG